MQNADCATVESRHELQQIRDRRRQKSRVKRMHHHALRTNDMEATRHFYEDILEMPMVSALVEMVDPTRGAETPYLHCFFEMGDGSSIAFFEFADGVRGKAPKTPQDALDHHFAVSVPNFDDIEHFKKKLESEGHKAAGIDHGFCYSLYFRDPNGMLVELVADHPQELEINEGYAAVAHDELEKWQRAEYVENNQHRADDAYPMKTSPIDEILKVLAEENQPS